ncbi:MAG: stage II sporulation protein D [Clostridia bacterium]|nr:stage II sporulation protein D [Clostridia bacterium]
MTLLVILFPICLNASFLSAVKDEEDLGGDIIDVYFASFDEVIDMPREDYILGVLMAEMPAEFELEALKAQAVAARTYLAQKISTSSSDGRHKGGDICTDSSHCQAYVSEKDAKEKWGKNASLYFEKCKNAVKSTKGVIAVYNGEPIKAVFHAYAGGKTENAEDVWGSDVAYLKSVASPGDEYAPKFHTEAEFSIDEFKGKLAESHGVNFTDSLIGDISRSEGGAVLSIELGDKVLKGSEVRTVFGLRSSSFDIIPCEDTVVFKVTGYGHGVGMSQYGANYYAKNGDSYMEILKKYYSGIDFATIENS